MASNVHYLYVKVVSKNDNDPASREITLKLLKFIYANLHTLQSMGVTVMVNRVRSMDLQNSLCIEAMRKKGITRLPALVTPNNIFIGLQNIVDLYNKNITAFTSMRSPARPPPRPQPSTIEDFYKSEMTMAKAARDSEDDTVGEGDNMMKAYQKMMTKRENPSARKRGAAMTASNEREDNVLMEEDDMGKLGGDVDTDLMNKAFTSHTNEDGDNGYQDDFMLRSYLANNGLDD